MLRDLVDKVEIRDVFDAQGKRQAALTVYYPFIGPFEPAYTPEETVALKVEAERREAEKIEQKKQRRLAYSRKKNAENRAKHALEAEGHPFREKLCARCGAPFWPTGPRQKYCSFLCRDRTR